MLPALIGAGASLLGGLFGASASNKAAKEAAAAQDRATQMNAMLAREQMQLAQQYNGPYANAGIPALNALQGRVLGGANPMLAGTPQKTGNAGGYYAEQIPQANWAAYINAPENADILNHYNSLPANVRATLGTPEQFAQSHWQGIGSTEGRAVTPYSQQAAPVAAPAGDSGPYGVPDDYAQPYAPRPTMEPFSFNRMAPNAQDYIGEGKFQADPGYQWRLDQTSRGITANSFAGGLGLSGSRLMALQDRAGNLADQTYGDFYNRAWNRYTTDLNQYNVDRNFARSGYDIDASRGDARYDTDRNFYNSDRGFMTGRFDTQTGDIFNLAGIGQAGAAAVTGAGQNMTNAMMQGNQQSADARGNAAIVGAANTNSMLQGALQGIGMFTGGGGWGGWGGSTRGGAIQPWGNFGGYGYTAGW